MIENLGPSYGQNRAVGHFFLKKKKKNFVAKNAATPKYVFHFCESHSILISDFFPMGNLGFLKTFYYFAAFLEHLWLAQRQDRI